VRQLGGFALNLQARDAVFEQVVIFNRRQLPKQVRAGEQRRYGENPWLLGQAFVSEPGEPEQNDGEAQRFEKRGFSMAW
jgi:hypothetical protein